MDILFVIPGGASKAAYQGLAVNHAIEPPAKARFAASYLMRRGVQVALLDASVLPYDPNQMAQQVKECGPDLVVMPVYGFNPSSSTHTMPIARSFAKAIKEECPEIPILIMGTHPAALPAKTLIDEPVDYVCGGEGPITIHELLLALQAGGNMADIRKVRSLWYFDNGQVVHNTPAPLIELHQEPVSHEAWWLMDPRNYIAHEWHTGWAAVEDRKPYANPYSREGCPFSCGFCNIQAPYREGESLLGRDSNSYRAVTPEQFVDELTFLREEFGVKHIKIPDEMFGLGMHPRKIAEKLRERHGDWFNIWCYFRVDTCRPEYLDLLRSAGFRWLGIGIEAANSTVRSGQDKGFTDERVHDVVDRIKAAGISPALNYIYGLPGDTMESMEQTFRLAVDLNSPFANFYCNQALPGSPQYDEAKRAGYPLPEREGGPGWIGHAQYGMECEPFYQGKALTPREILAFRDWAHVAYYRRPEYREMIRRQYGEVALKTQNFLTQGQRALKRTLLGGKSFWELSEDERSKLVPISAKFVPTNPSTR